MYWFNSCITECYIVAKDTVDAIKRFKVTKGDKHISSIEEVEKLPSYY